MNRPGAETSLATQAQPQVVLLPGLDGSGRLFQPLLHHLANRFPAQVVSYPGDRALSYDQLADETAARLPDGPFVLIAESFSGPVAVKLAARTPGGLVAVVLVATFVTPPARSLWRLTPWRWLLRIPLGREIIGRLLCGGDRTLASQIDAALASVRADVLVARLRETLCVDVTRELRRTDQPLLYVQARYDRLVPDRCLDTIRALRPDLAVASLDTHHFVLQLAPEAAWRAIEAFLRDGGRRIR